MTGQAKAGIALGIVAGLALGAVGGMAGRFAQRIALEHPKRPWPVTPMVVTKRELPVGHVITMDDLGQQSIPDPQATAALVTPQYASHLVGQAIEAPLAAGQPLEWSFFDVASTAQREPTARAACNAALTTQLGPPRVETLKDIEARLARRAP